MRYSSPHQFNTLYLWFCPRWRPHANLFPLVSTVVAALCLTLAGCITARPADSPATLPAGDTPAAGNVVPLAEADARPPAQLAIDAIELDVPVVAMGWRIVDVDGERTTDWIVPEEAAGWHINSALPGTAGNVVISGHQLLGAAVFAPLALGEVETGQAIQLTDEEDAVFTYRVVEVSEPIPLAGATADDLALAEAYLAGDAAADDTEADDTEADDAQLTLITGWPDYTTTHRVFVVAELASVTQ